MGDKPVVNTDDSFVAFLHFLEDIDSYNAMDIIYVVEKPYKFGGEYTRFRNWQKVQDMKFTDSPDKYSECCGCEFYTISHVAGEYSNSYDEYICDACYNLCELEDM